jgi:hypothetical protein
MPDRFLQRNKNVQGHSYGGGHPEQQSESRVKIWWQNEYFKLKLEF